MTTNVSQDETRRTHRRGLRMTSRVFWDMAIYMVGLGLVMGLIFPPFVVVLGVPETFAYRPVFRLACLMAGFMVGAMRFSHQRPRIIDFRTSAAATMTPMRCGQTVTRSRARQ